MFPFSWLGKPVSLVQEERDSDYQKLHTEEALDQMLQLSNAQKPSSSCSSLAKSECLRWQHRILYLPH